MTTAVLPSAEPAKAATEAVPAKQAAAPEKAAETPKPETPALAAAVAAAAETPADPLAALGKKPAEPATVYEFKPPEGFTPGPDNDAHVENLRAFAAENKLTPEQAQAAYERETVGMQARLAENVKGYETELRADPNFGGAKLPQSVKYAEAALADTRYFEPEFVAMLHRTGLAKYPPMFRMLARLGAAKAEPAAAVTGSPSSNPLDPSTLFPKSLPKTGGA